MKEESAQIGQQQGLPAVGSQQGLPAVGSQQGLSAGGSQQGLSAGGSQQAEAHLIETTHMQQSLSAVGSQAFLSAVGSQQPEPQLIDTAHVHGASPFAGRHFPPRMSVRRSLPLPCAIASFTSSSVTTEITSPSASAVHQRT
jgi:hypothetical protein